MLLEPTAVPTLLVAKKKQKKKKSNNNKVCIWNQSHFFSFSKNLHHNNAAVRVTRHTQYNLHLPHNSLAFVHCWSVSAPLSRPSSFHLDIFFFLLCYLTHLRGKKPLWVLILYLPTAATMSGFPGPTTSFISDLQSDTWESCSNVHI